MEEDFYKNLLQTVFGDNYIENNYPNTVPFLSDADKPQSDATNHSESTYSPESSPKSVKSDLSQIGGWMNVGAGVLNAINVATGGGTNKIGNTLSSLSAIGALPIPGAPVIGAAFGIAGAVANGLTNDTNKKYIKSTNNTISKLAQSTSNANDFTGLSQAYNSLQNQNIDLGDLDNWGSTGMFIPEHLSKRYKARESAKDALGVAKMQAMSNLNQQGRNINQNNMFKMYSNLRASGGALHTNGSTWDTGITYIGNGGSHESNPYEGVQVGVDPQGIPNLVEEGEVIWDDYVFSKRLKVPKTFKDKYNLKKKESLSFAEAAEKLAEESKERPNDSISKRGRDAMLSSLKDQQEQVRLKMKQRQAKAQFNKLSPEEQLGIMQMAQQQGAMVGPEGDVNNMYQEAPLMAAFGGNLFKGGGSKGKKPRPKTGKYTYDWFLERAKALGIDLETFKNDFVYDDQNKINNLNLFNDIYEQYQRQTALDAYIKGRRKDWENTELESGRFKKSDDGTSIYKAKYYTKDDVGKDYISSAGNRITTEEYNKEKEAYNIAKAIDSKKRKEADNKTIEDFENASYKHSPVVQNQFAKDYNGNILYDYDTDVSKTWIPDDNTFSKDFKWDPKDVARISYDPEQHNSLLSNLRYSPVLGAITGLVTDIFTKPDYTRADEIKKAGTYLTPLVSANPIGNYLRYNPMDINYGLNKLGAESSAVRRSIMNASQGNVGSAMSGLLAAGYNSQIATGDLYRKALEYNDSLLNKVKTFNNNIDIFNSQQGLEAQKANQNALLHSFKDRYNGILAGNTFMDQIDARKNNSMNANLTNLFNSLGQIGEEAYDYDRINSLIERDVLKDLYG